MSWIDIRLQKPPEEAATNGRNFFRLCDGSVIRFSNSRLSSVVAWMPIPEFTPVKLLDPPEGYELLTDYDAEWHPDTMHWVDGRGEWQHSGLHHRREYIEGKFFSVPIKPPEPQYRPFASAEEFRPYRDRWCRRRRKGDETNIPPVAYNNTHRGGLTWATLLEHYEFDDGTPFGLPID